MTISELISILKEHNPSTRVGIGSNGEFIDLSKKDIKLTDDTWKNKDGTVDTVLALGWFEE